MNVHRLVIMVVDFDEIGAEGIKGVIENARFPNDCIHPHVMEVDTRDIGEWHDEHPLNYLDCNEEFDELFTA